LWEDTLTEAGKLMLHSRLARADDIYRIDHVEDVLELDSQMAVPIATIASVLGVAESAIKNVAILKKGTVNHTYTFMVNGEKYVVRVPGYGIAKPAIQLRESATYQALRGQKLADDVLYVNDNTGLKISRFIPDSRQCDPFDEEDVRRCFTALRQMHDKHVQVEHRFDLFDTILYFESLWDGDTSVYADYEDTKKAVFSLRRYIGAHKHKACLTHIDPVPENFLLTDDGVRLIDWEYAAMQNPHVDIAMFCLYSLYNRQQVDRAIELYFDGNVEETTRIKIYCYMAVGGLLWSNWCESKHKNGTEFGVYALKQYRYAKEYYRIVQDELKGAL
jgi:thiamine kinase-like enzyme